MEWNYFLSIWEMQSFFHLLRFFSLCWHKTLCYTSNVHVYRLIVVVVYCLYYRISILHKNARRARRIPQNIGVTHCGQGNGRRWYISKCKRTWTPTLLLLYKAWHWYQPHSAHDKPHTEQVGEKNIGDKILYPSIPISNIHIHTMLQCILLIFSEQKFHLQISNSKKMSFIFFFCSISSLSGLFVWFRSV